MFYDDKIGKNKCKNVLFGNYLALLHPARSSLPFIIIIIFLKYVLGQRLSQNYPKTMSKGSRVLTICPGCRVAHAHAHIISVLNIVFLR